MITLPAPGRFPYALLQLCYRKNTSLTFYTHPVLGGCQNNSAIGTSPDPLSPREGLACEASLEVGHLPMAFPHATSETPSLTSSLGSHSNSSQYLTSTSWARRAQARPHDAIMTAAHGDLTRRDHTHTCRTFATAA